MPKFTLKKLLGLGGVSLVAVPAGVFLGVKGTSLFSSNEIASPVTANSADSSNSAGNVENSSSTPQLTSFSCSEGNEQMMIEMPNGGVGIDSEAIEKLRSQMAKNGRCSSLDETDPEEEEGTVEDEEDEDDDFEEEELSETTVY